MKKTVKQILAENLKKLMKDNPGLDSQPKIAAKAQKIGGGKVAQTSISNMLNPNSQISPKIDTLEAVAAVFGLQAWQLVHPTLGDLSIANDLVSRVLTAPSKDQNLIYQILEMDAVPDYQVARRLRTVKTLKPK